MSETKAKAEVDKRVCISAGACMEVAPGAFEFDADGKAVFVPSAGADRDALLDAQQTCPSGAITVEEEGA